MATCPSCRKSYPDGVEVCDEDGTTLVVDAIFASEDEDIEPDVMVGDYRIERRLGRGGFGTVYQAVHPLIKKRAAVKVLHRTASAKPEMVSRFVAEARAVNKIRSAHIVNIFSFGTLNDGRYYCVMDLLEGDSLKAILDERERLEPATLVAILRQLGGALDIAHRAGIIHRDIKPANVMVRFDDEGGPVAKLLDFGVAKLLDPDVDAQHRTVTGTPIGTPYYMSPEQCRGEPVDRRSDIYALGVMAFEALTGRRPFVADSAVRVMMMHANSPPPAASGVHPPLGDAFDAPLKAMLAKDPDRRPSNADEAVELLAAARAEGLEVPPLQLPAGTPPPASAFDTDTTVRSLPKLTPGSEQASGEVRSDRQLTEARSVSATTSPKPRRPATSWRTLLALGLAVMVAGIWYALQPSSLGPATLASATATQADGGAADVLRSAAPSARATTITPAATSAATAEVQLTLRSTVPRAIARLDGEMLGPVPGSYALKRGAHRLEVKAPGRRARRYQLQLEEDRELDIELELMPSPARGDPPSVDELEF